MKYRITRVEEVEVNFEEEFYRIYECFEGDLRQKLLVFTQLVQSGKYDEAYAFLDEHFEEKYDKEHECGLMEFIWPELLDIVYAWVHRDLKGITDIERL